MTELLTVKTIETPVGKMQAIASDRGLCALEFLKPDRQKLLDARLARWFPAEHRQVDSGNPILVSTNEWLNTYFEGNMSRLPTIKLDPRGTDFEMRVWQEMRKLQPGETISYGALAAKIGNPNASRAVGNASRRNPIALIVPCHRVIGSNGKLTGYGGGLNQKEWLIRHESNSTIDRPIEAAQKSLFT